MSASRASFLGYAEPARRERPALYDADAGGWWTYGELAGEVAAMRSLLAPAPKSLVFLFGRNQLAVVVAYLAAIEAGHALALLDAGMAPAFKRALLEAYQPEFILDAAGDDYGERAHLLAERPLPLWRARKPSCGLLHPELALLLSTSGSTGSPRFVRLTRANVEANAGAIAQALGIGSAERAIASLPLAYAYGLSILNSHLWAGASCVLTGESVVSQPFWQLFREQACSSFAGVPYTYTILDRIGFERLELPGLRHMTQAGGKLGDELIAKFHGLMQRRGGRFTPMYGQTEATARIAVMPAGGLPQKLGSVGLALPGGALRLERDGQPVLKPFTQGEVVYEGPNVMQGYASCRAELERGDELGGVLRTGDLGHLDEQGYLFITGRAKRFAKVFGMRVNLEEVEALLRHHGPTAVVEAQDGLVVFCEYGEGESHQALARELASQLKLNQSAFRFRRLEALPLMSSGKVDYERLRNDLP